MKTGSQSLRHAIPTRSRRSARSGVGEVLLTLVSIGGVLCIVGVLAALMFNITLIMFKTGSMSPTIPTGSLAVVREIAAKDVRIGDITTIDRPGALPITHRVTAITVLAGGSRAITMKGDANTQPDAEPYVVNHVRRVLFSVPRLAYVVANLSNPVIVGGIAAGVTGLVTWAFWPRAREPHGRRRELRARRRLSRQSGSGASLLVILAVVGLLIIPTARAAAAEVDAGGEIDVVTRGSSITLTSVANPDEAGSLSPGRPTYWQVGILSTAADPGTIHIALSAVGQLAGPGGLTVTVNACSVRWVANNCAGGSTLWLASQPLATASRADSGGQYGELGTVQSTKPVWLMLTMILPTSTTVGAFANIQIHARGVGDDLVATGPTQTALASTGASIMTPIALSIAAVLVGLGAAATERTRLRRRVR